jgi:hypothetical protein
MRPALQSTTLVPSQVLGVELEPTGLLPGTHSEAIPQKYIPDTDWQENPGAILVQSKVWVWPPTHATSDVPEHPVPSR